MKWNAFISHAYEDKEFAHQIFDTGFYLENLDWHFFYGAFSGFSDCFDDLSLSAYCGKRKSYTIRVVVI